MINDVSKDFLYLEDKVFKLIVRAISPEIIETENGPLLDSFADSLGNLSPISINITDVFYKPKGEWDPVLNKPPTNYIKNVQDINNHIYMNNFWKLKNKYNKNYLINHYLADTLYQYSLIGDIDLSEDYKFFENYDQLFTEDKHVGNREFKLRKGSKTSLKYAYKNVWNAKVEGILQEDYFFEVDDDRFDKLLWIGACINPDDPSFTPDPDYYPFPPYYDNPYSYPPQEPFCDDTTTCNCTEPGKRIGDFIVSGIIGGQTLIKEKFRYDATGSLMPIFFNTMVKDLAHPVGFQFTYKRYFELNWEDLFNTVIPVYADKVIVRTLCYENDCSKTVNEYYATNGNETCITGSTLDKIEYYKEYLDEPFDITKFTFKNGQFLIQKYNDEAEKIIIEYYDNDFTNFDNLLPNGDFDNSLHWSLGDRWSIRDGHAILTQTGSNDLLTQSIILEPETKYIFEIDVTEIDGMIELDFDENYIIKVTNPGKYFVRFFNYESISKEVMIYDSDGNSTAKINFVKIYKDIPKKIYKDSWHSSVIMEGFKYLRPVNTTTDESECLIDTGDIIPFDPNNPNCGDYLNDLPRNYGESPILGEEIMIGSGTTSGNLNYFEIGCNNPSNGEVYPPYLTPEECCEANEIHNPPGTPSGTCIYGSILYNDYRLKYIYDIIDVQELNTKQRVDLVNVGFDTNWNIVSGNATIVDGILSQDGTQESIIERTLDTCPFDGDFITVKYLAERINSTETNIRVEYVNFDGNVLFSAKVDSTLINCEWGWLINDSSCDDINKVKIRLILPVDYSIPMKNIEIFKY